MEDLLRYGICICLVEGSNRGDQSICIEQQFLRCVPQCSQAVQFVKEMICSSNLFGNPSQSTCIGENSQTEESLFLKGLKIGNLLKFGKPLPSASQTCVHVALWGITSPLLHSELQGNYQKSKIKNAQLFSFLQHSNLWLNMGLSN